MSFIDGNEAQTPRGVDLLQQVHDLSQWTKSTLGTRALLGAPGIATRNKDATRGPGVRKNTTDWDHMVAPAPCGPGCMVA